MSNKSKLKSTFLSLLCLALFSSCLTNVDEEIELDPCDEITFTMNVKPIIDNNCVGCHSASGQASFLILDTYETVAANAAKVKSEVVIGDMPIGGSLTTEEIQAISCWVDAGALNN